jgi:polysaccharide biosynthesis transport protein
VSRTTMMTDISKRDIAFLFFKRKNQILLAFGVTLILATVSSYISPRTYEATATVYVVRNLPPIAATGPTTLNQVLDRREVLNSEVDLITSRAVAEQVADDLGLGKDDGRPRRQPSGFVAAVRAVPAAIRGALLNSGLIDGPGDPRAGIVSGLLSGLNVAPAVNSNFITISYRGENPAEAARIVNAFTKVYLDRRLSLVKRPGLESFYEQQIVRARTEVQQIESELKVTKGRTGVVSGDEQLRLALEEQSRLDASIRDVQSVREETEQRMAALQKRIESQPDSVVSSRLMQRSPELAALDRRRLELEAERAVELNRFSETSVPIQELDRSIARIKEAMAKEPQTVVNSESVSPNGIRATLQTDLFRAESDHAAAEAREKALVSRRAAVAAEVRRLDQDSVTVRRLSEAATVASRTYDTYMRQKEEARMSAETDTGVTNVQVVSAATPPTRPLYPRLLEVIIGATLGLILGVGWAFLAEIFSQTLDRRDDVERELDLPVLASIPLVNSKQLRLS